MKKVPYYWRLSAFYFFYFGSLGALMPYISLYLKALGFEAQAIGELIAIIMATKIIAPNLLGWIADKTGRHIALVRVTSFLTVLGFLGLLIVHAKTLSDYIKENIGFEIIIKQPGMSDAIGKLVPGLYVVGSSPAAHIQLDSLDVSAKHAQLIVSETSLTILDTNSCNGVFIDSFCIRSVAVCGCGASYFGWHACWRRLLYFEPNVSI